MKLQEKRWEFDKHLHMMFVDFEQAHDVINGIGLWRSFEIRGLPLKSVKTYKKPNVKLNSEKNTYTQIFQVTAGLKRGYALSSMFFNQRVARKVKKKLNS